MIPLPSAEPRIVGVSYTMFTEDCMDVVGSSNSEEGWGEYEHVCERCVCLPLDMSLYI